MGKVTDRGEETADKASFQINVVQVLNEPIKLWGVSWDSAACLIPSGSGRQIYRLTWFSSREEFSNCKFYFEFCSTAPCTRDMADRSVQ